MGDIEKINFDDDMFEEKLEFALNSIGGSSDYSNKRDREYNGQPHTTHGVRGKEEVKGLTMRDISDCYIKALLLSASETELYEKVEKGTWRYRDVYEIDLEKIDPIAVEQNIGCEIERMMGIYPNVKDCPSVDKITKDLTLDE